MSSIIDGPLCLPIVDEAGGDVVADRDHPVAARPPP
jgi:hypothetical protein